MRGPMQTIGVTGRRMSRALRCLFAAAVVVLLPVEAMAKSRVCAQLEADLAAASRGGGASAKARKYDQAIARQRSELAKARSQARGGNCGLSLFGLGRCGKLDTTIDKMERNLATLEQDRAGMGGGSTRRDRNRIVVALNANGCSDEEVTVRRLPQPVAVDQRNAELLERVLVDLAQDEPFPDELDEDGERNVRQVLNPSTGLRFEGLEGSYRTLCVRTCDGYFFPVSNQSTRLDFDRDRKNCEATCPGAEVQLFYQRTDGDGSEEMTSAATGMPYGQLSNAYLYKNVNAPQPAMCGCAAREKGFSIIAGKTRQDEPPPSENFIPRPVARPDPGADPETLANAQGGLTTSKIEELLTPPKVATLPPSGERKVRVVGPAFLPDLSEAVDLRAPARTAVR